MLKKLLSLLFVMTLSTPLWAAESYNIKQVTPQIQQAIDQRTARFSQLQALKAAGSLGENNQGYVQSFDSAAAVLADAENQDRRTIYEAIVQQNNLGANNLRKVEQVFAEVQREKARAGERIQTPSGEWITK